MTPPARDERRTCTICGEAEPFHIHDGDRRIDDYFTVGRGQTDFDAAQAWKARALRAEAALEADLAALREAAQAVVDESAEHPWLFAREPRVINALRAVLASADSESREETP